MCVKDNKYKRKKFNFDSYRIVIKLFLDETKLSLHQCEVLSL